MSTIFPHFRYELAKCYLLRCTLYHYVIPREVMLNYPQVTYHLAVSLLICRQQQHHCSSGTWRWPETSATKQERYC